ncbi:helix-turn-helix domain-containing protein [Kitasatospora sp. NPDC059571]|uniref:MmyB family transcriptional regulator n=1 Tax=Kitasatospora sp. NPDC059571 TaxID=3346871 RepID=UPI003679C8B1
MEFSTSLRECRARLRISQLELAHRAGTSQRHVSFMESGRSAPGRTMVLRLADSLGLSLRECNELLLTAGYAPAYPESGVHGAAIAPVRQALERVLTGHLPWPALVVDGSGALVAANSAFDRLVEGADPELCAVGANVYRLALHPRGLGPRVANLADWARHILVRLRQDTAAGSAELYTELSALVPESAGGGEPLGFAVPLVLRSPRGELRLFTTVTTFATATDVTLAELKLEAFLPADERTARLLAEEGSEEREVRGGRRP